MSEHAFLSASDSPRWLNCAAALRHTKDIEDRGSAAADWGTAAHEVAAWCLSNNAQAADYPHRAVTVAGSEWVVTEEMRECVDIYLEFVRKRIKGGTLMVEQKMAYGTYLFPGVLDLNLRDHKTNAFNSTSPNAIAFGTGDAPIVMRHARINDLKTGANPYNKVSADHPQLKLYGLGMLHEYGMVEEIETVTASICQPRLEHYPEVTFTVDELLTWAKEVAAPAAQKALAVYNRESEPTLADFTVTDDGCKWCSGKATCPALRANIEEETRDLFASFVPSAAEPGQEVMPAAQIDQDVIGALMAKVPLLEEFTKAVRAEAERRLLAGQPVTGFKLVEGRRGPRQWTDANAAEKLIREKFRLKVDEAYDLKLKSPTQIEKVLKDSPRRWKQLQDLIGQTDGKPSVAPESDARRAIEVSGVEDKFAQLAVREMLTQSVDELV